MRTTTSPTTAAWPDHPATVHRPTPTVPLSGEQLADLGHGRQGVAAAFTPCAPDRYVPADLLHAGPTGRHRLAIELRTRGHWQRHREWIACSWSSARYHGMRWFCDEADATFLTPATARTARTTLQAECVSLARSREWVVEGAAAAEPVDPASPGLLAVPPQIACAQIIQAASRGRPAWPVRPVPGMTPQQVRTVQVADAVCRWWGLAPEQLVALMEGMLSQAQLRLVAGRCDGGADSPAETVVRLACRGLAEGMVSQYRVRVGGRVVSVADLAWPERRVLVFYDGSHHESRDQWIADMDRTTTLSVAGWTVIRLTRQDLRSPAGIRARVAAALR